MSQHHPMPGELGPNAKPGPNVELLRDFCKEELAAAQTYEKALGLPNLRRHADVLGRCYASHQNRVAELSHRIVSLGGEAPNSPGVWSSLLPTLAIAAVTVSEALAISLLEDAEDHAASRYSEHVNDLDPDNRAFAVERIVPAQDVSHAAISQLNQALQA
jgi:hypothetical protein